MQYKKIFDFPFKNSVIWFVLFAIVFQCVFHISVLLDIFQSFKLLFLNNISLELKILRILYYFSFIMIYVMYWFLLSSLVVLPTLILAKYQILRPILYIYLLIIFTFITTYSNLDFFIFKHYQFHIGEGMLDWLINLKQTGKLNHQFLKDFSISGQEMDYFIMMSGVILFIYLSLILFSIWLVKRYPFKSYLHQFCWSFAFFLVAFGFYLREINRDEPWLISQINQYPLLKVAFKQGSKWKFFKNLSDDRPVLVLHSVNRSLKQPKPILATMHHKPNVLWIVVDTLRYDMVNTTHMPFLSKYQQQNLSFDNHWSSGNSTQAGVFGMLYSLPVNYFSSTVKYHTSPFIFEMFKNNGYLLNMFYSSNIKLPPFDQNVFSGFSKPQLHLIEEVNRDHSDELNVSQLQAFLKESHKKPFFSFVLLESVHNYCMKQSFPLVYADAATHCERWKLNEDYNPLPMKKRYLNAVHYIDGKLQEIIHTLKQQGLYDNTLIIITSDHGESFNDYHTNLWGHSTGYTKEQIKVPLIIHWPGKKPQSIDYQTTHYDIPVTLLKEILNYDYPTKEYLLGGSLFSPHPSAFLMVGSYVFMGVVLPNKYYVLSSDGAIQSYNQFAQPLMHDKIGVKDYASALQIMSRFYAN